MNRYTQYLLTLSQMIRAELVLAFKALPDKLIDLAIYVVATLAVSAYLLPLLGMHASFGVITLAGVIVTAAFFELWPGATNLISDFTGENVTAYYLTLPIPAAFVFIRLIIIYAINGLILSIWSLPIGLLVLWTNTAGLSISPFHLAVALIVMNIFFGTFTLWMASYIQNILKAGSIWMRFVFPLWFFGGFQFSWYMLHDISRFFAYIDLFNPVIYAMESSKVALLGQKGYLPFWPSMGALLVFSVLFSIHGIYRLKRRLDFI